MRGRALLTIASLVLVAGVAVAAAATRPVGPADVSERPLRLERAPRSISVVAVGDWLPESRVLRAAAGGAPPGVRYDHVPLLAPVAGMIASADLAICHMEVPIGAPGEESGFRGRATSGTSLISAPHEVAGDLRRVGFDRCSTASNHSNDLGAAGIGSTLAAFDDVAISHTGTARTPAESAVDVIDVEGVRVAHRSYALNSNTGFPRDDWRIDRATDPQPVIGDVAAARLAGAELVIVSLHVFVEMQPTPEPADRSLVEAITSRSEVDLVVIHGPHVVQPMEHVNGVPVFWSLGNFVSGMGVPGRGKYSDVRTLDGLLAAVRFTEQGDGSFTSEAAPVLLCQMVDTRVVYPGLSTPRTPAIDACIARSGAVVAGLR